LPYAMDLWYLTASHRKPKPVDSLPLRAPLPKTEKPALHSATCSSSLHSKLRQTTPPISRPNSPQCQPKVGKLSVLLRRAKSWRTCHVQSASPQQIPPQFSQLPCLTQLVGPQRRIRHQALGHLSRRLQRQARLRRQHHRSYQAFLPTGTKTPQVATSFATGTVRSGPKMSHGPA